MVKKSCRSSFFNPWLALVRCYSFILPVHCFWSTSLKTMFIQIFNKYSVFALLNNNKNAFKFLKFEFCYKLLPFFPAKNPFIFTFLEVLNNYFQKSLKYSLGSTFEVVKKFFFLKNFIVFCWVYARNLKVLTP